MQKKLKAITFSYDDGVVQDKRLIDMFNRYGIKGTFNLNSGLFGKGTRLPLDEICKIYEGQEVAVHTSTHPQLASLSDEEIINEVAGDRKKLSEIFGYEVLGMAYPYGLPSGNERVINLIKNHTGVHYSRNTDSTHSFDLPSDYYNFNCTARNYHFDDMERLAEEFFALKPDKPALFSIWGHSYEFDTFENWDRMEGFLERISGCEDVFYGTNTEVLISKLHTDGWY